MAKEGLHLDPAVPILGFVPMAGGRYRRNLVSNRDLGGSYANSISSAVGKDSVLQRRI